MGGRGVCKPIPGGGQGRRGIPQNPRREAAERCYVFLMKTILGLVLPGFLLVSCVFDEPFFETTDRPVDAALLGRWESVPAKEGDAPQRLLVLQHSANEYLIEYPAGEDAMVFRGQPVDLDGGAHVQIQLIGGAEGPAEPHERKYHLLRVAMDERTLTVRTIDPEKLGAKEDATSEALRAAFAAKKDDPGLFGEPMRFERMK